MAWAAMGRRQEDEGHGGEGARGDAEVVELDGDREEDAHLHEGRRLRGGRHPGEDVGHPEEADRGEEGRDDADQHERRGEDVADAHRDLSR
jgi:hypothetical protein